MKLMCLVADRKELVNAINKITRRKDEVPRTTDLQL